MTTLVHLELQLDPRKTDTEVAELLQEVLSATRAFPGNLDLEVVVDDADPTRLLVIETWAAASDHDAYVAWRGTPEGTSRLGELLAAPRVKRTFTRRIPLAL